MPENRHCEKYFEAETIKEVFTTAVSESTERGVKLRRSFLLLIQKDRIFSLLRRIFFVRTKEAFSVY